MTHNTPIKPPEETLAFMRENYKMTYSPPHEKKQWVRIHSSFKGCEVGTSANGCKVHDGYKRIRTKGKTYKYHHVVWLLRYKVWPEKQLNHIDGDKLNCHPDNLEYSDTKSNNADRWARWKAKHQKTLRGAA